jgi:hypothetical protein
MPDPLHWTKAPPDQPGFYWYRVPTASPVVIEVEKHFGVLYVYFQDADVRAPVVSLFDAEWAGPIDRPIETH